MTWPVKGAIAPPTNNFVPYNAKKLPDNQRPSLKKMAKRGKKLPSFGKSFK